MRVVSLPSARSARSQTSPGRVSERRTLPLWDLGREVLSKNAESLRDSDALMRVAVPRRRGPAGLRNTLFDLPMLHFSRSAYGDFCVCEVETVSLPSAYSAYCRNFRCPLVKTTNLLFPWSDRFFFDSSSTKYYPFFFTDTGRTSGRPAGSFAFVCISLTCSDRHDRGT